MQGTVAQIVALTTYGNSILQAKRDSKNLALQGLDDAFRFCESIKFIDLVQGAVQKEEHPYAEDPYDWFEHLKQEQTYSILMSYGPSSGANKIADRILVAFVGGGGRWLMETNGPDRTDYWKSRWLVGDRERRDKKIWRVTYVRVLSTTPKERPKSEDLDKLKIELKQAVEDIREVSRSHNLEWFTKAFDSALARLQSPAPLEGLRLCKQIAPDGFLSLSANQLLAAAQAAWVFGGMGSWNDQGLKGPQYEAVSERLYQLLNRVIVAVANSRSLSNS